MKTAREIIARRCFDHIGSTRLDHADAILAALTDEGWTLTPPGGVHAPTLESAAKVADNHAVNAWEIALSEGQNDVCASGRNHGARAVATAIRALASRTEREAKT